MNAVQRSAKRLVRGCEKFLLAPAYLFCLVLPGSCLVKFTNLLAGLCTEDGVRLDTKVQFISFSEVSSCLASQLL